MDQAPSPTLSPMIGVPKVADAMTFYEKVFGARKVGPYLTAPDGAVVHAQLAFGDSLVMLADLAAGAAASPAELGQATARFALEVADVDAVWTAALAEGCEVLIPLSDQFYGQRSGRLRDPFGHEWVVGQTIEQVDPEEMQRRMAELFGAQEG